MISEEKRERLRQAVCDLTERYRTAGYFPSACVRVFDAEGTLATVCAGDAREDSLFDAASLTKIATATQALRLISAGKLELQAPLEALFPEISPTRRMTPPRSMLTIRFSMAYPLGVRLQSSPSRFARRIALSSSTVRFPFSRSEIKLRLSPLASERKACVEPSSRLLSRSARPKEAASVIISSILPPYGLTGTVIPQNFAVRLNFAEAIIN